MTTKVGKFGILLSSGFFALAGFVLASSLAGCFGSSKKSPEEPVPVDASLIVAKMQTPSNPNQRDEFLVTLIKISLQADQVAREAGRVLSDEKKSADRSPFGKIHRAGLMAQDGRLAKKGFFGCDRYAVERKRNGPRTEAWIFEDCSGRKELAHWKQTGTHQADVEFTPSNLGEVLGTGASILARKFTCTVTWTDAGILDTLSCPGWEQDRGSQIARLATFEYKKDAGSILKLRGQMLENLQPVRKVEANVPLAGRITVVETELNAPPPEPPAAPSMPSTPSVASRPGRAAVNPDLLQRRLQLQQQQQMQMRMEQQQQGLQRSESGIPQWNKAWGPPPPGMKVEMYEEVEVEQEPDAADEGTPPAPPRPVRPDVPAAQPPSSR